MRYSTVQFFSLLMTASLWTGAQAADYSIRITDQNGNPLSNAVVESPTAPVTQPPAVIAVMDQVDKRFVPMVIAVQQGQRVDFPNKDNIRHHVYSFSTIKQFSTELYADVPGEPVLFDQAGIAVLGCNIHDSMVGYIYVSAWQHIAVTDVTGTVTLSQDSLPEQLTVWHPWSTDLDNRRIVSTAPMLDGANPLEVVLTINEPEQVFGFRALNGG